MLVLTTPVSEPVLVPSTATGTNLRLRSITLREGAKLIEIDIGIYDATNALLTSQTHQLDGTAFFASAAWHTFETFVWTQLEAAGVVPPGTVSPTP